MPQLMYINRNVIFILNYLYLIIFTMKLFRNGFISLFVTIFYLIVHHKNITNRS